MTDAGEIREQRVLQFIADVASRVRGVSVIREGLALAWGRIPSASYLVAETEGAECTLSVTLNTTNDTDDTVLVSRIDGRGDTWFEVFVLDAELPLFVAELASWITAFREGKLRPMVFPVPMVRGDGSRRWSAAAAALYHNHVEE